MPGVQTGAGRQIGDADIFFSRSWVSRWPNECNAFSFLSMQNELKSGKMNK
jgi:hypothetical protein